MKHIKETIVVNGLKITPAMFAILHNWFNGENNPVDSYPNRMTEVLIEVQDMITQELGENITNNDGSNFQRINLLHQITNLRKEFKSLTPNHTYYEQDTN
jgi:hypothetical protein